MKWNKMNHILDEITLTEADKQRILENCGKQRHVSNKVFLYSKQIAAVFAVCVLGVSSLTAYAAVNAYQEYMKKMPPDEIGARFEAVQEGQKEADTFSRALSDDESTKLMELGAAYEAGTAFPAESMTLFAGDTTTFSALEVELAYDFVNCVFYLPERELTEEELLQIVDVWGKANYSLGILNENEEAKDPAQVMKDNCKEVTADEDAWIREIGNKVLTEIVKENPENGVWDIVLYGKDEPAYMATWKADKKKCQFYLSKNSTRENWGVYHYYSTESTDEERSNGETATAGTVDAEASSISGEERLQLGEKYSKLAMQQLKDYFGADGNLIRCDFGYAKDRLCIAAYADDGNRYRLYYDVVTGQLKELLTYEAGKYDDVEILRKEEVLGSISCP